MSMPVAVVDHRVACATRHWMKAEFDSGLVSVIVPTYNRAHLISETLDSVVAQTYRPIEIVIINDGSIDNTCEVVRKWERDNQQSGVITKYLTQSNSGASAARNLGLIESQGEFIQFLDSDDLIHPEKISRQVSALNGDGSDYAFSSYVHFHVVPTWRTMEYTNFPRRWSVADHLRKSEHLNAIAGLYRRSICDQMGPWAEKMRVFEDTEYNLRLLLGVRRISFVCGVLAAYRATQEPRVSDRVGTAEMIYSLRRLEEVLRQFNVLTAPNANALAAVCLYLASSALELGNVATSRDIIRLGLGLAESPSRRARLKTLKALSYWPSWLASPTTRLLRSCYRWRLKVNRKHITTNTGELNRAVGEYVPVVIDNGTSLSS